MEPATLKQRSAIYGIAARWGCYPSHDKLKMLSVAQASALINDLNDVQSKVLDRHHDKEAKKCLDINARRKDMVQEMEQLLTIAYV